MTGTPIQYFPKKGSPAQPGQIVLAHRDIEQTVNLVAYDPLYRSMQQHDNVPAGERAKGAYWTSVE